MKNRLSLSDTLLIGDLLHYCPADLQIDKHDIGIIYEINEDNFDKQNKKIKTFKIFWSRTNMHDMYSSTTLDFKLKQKIKNKNMLQIIRQNE